MFFKNIEDLRAWLTDNHLLEKELWLGYYKKKSPRYNFSWSDSVDELLCFGWIDGIRKSIDDERYMIRITPRKTTSIWSEINLQKVTRLKRESKMFPAGLKIYEARNPDRSERYSFEQKNDIKLPKKYLSLFKNNQGAWKNFEAFSPSIKKQSIWWVISAKRETTRARRIQELINYASQNKKIPQLDWKKK